MSSAGCDDIDACLAFYGIPDLSRFDHTKIKCPVKEVLGSLDERLMDLKEGSVRKALNDAFAAAGVKYEEKIWEGVGHAFMCPDRENYSKEVSELAFADGVEWMKK